jgi:hypothetical protein
MVSLICRRNIWEVGDLAINSSNRPVVKYYVLLALEIRIEHFDLEVSDFFILPLSPIFSSSSHRCPTLQ